MLCGDEIKSAVIDIGSSVCRFGTAGQDVPRHVFKSRLGSYTDGDNKASIVGDVNLRCLSHGVDIRRPSFLAGGREDIEHLLQYGVEDSMRLQIADTPLFLSHNATLGGWSTSSKELQSSKEKVLETCFEGVGAPAMYLGNSAMLSAFSMGRTNSLVIDIGSYGTKITPVVDGYELRKSSVVTTRGGDLMDCLLQEEMVRRIGGGGGIRPWFDCQKSGGVLKAVSVRPTFRAFHVGEVVQDVKQWMCFVPHAPIVTPAETVDPAVVSRLREEELQRRLLHFPPPYELPDGMLVHAGEALCTVPERVFFPFAGGESSHSSHGFGTTGSAAATQSRKRTRELLDATFPESSSGGAEGAGMGMGDSSSFSGCGASSAGGDSLMAKLGARTDQESLADLVYACVAHADPDVRKELLGNIQIVGGGSLIQGLAQRLVHELSGIVPSHMKVKLVTGLPVERHHAAWIGGSILGICGSFQQLWLTRQEYDELGPVRAALRFDH